MVKNKVEAQFQRHRAGLAVQLQLRYHFQPAPVIPLDWYCVVLRPLCLRWWPTSAAMWRYLRWPTGPSSDERVGPFWYLLLQMDLVPRAFLDPDATDAWRSPGTFWPLPFRRISAVPLTDDPGSTCSNQFPSSHKRSRRPKVHLRVVKVCPPSTSESSTALSRPLMSRWLRIGSV